MPGRRQEAYVWPYFARLPVKSLTPAQKVELFRVVTGSDYKEMLERGRYVFYQVGIGARRHLALFPRQRVDPPSRRDHAAGGRKP